MVAEWREQAIESAREHGFTGAWGTNQQQIVRASSSDLQRPFTLFLTDDISDVPVALFYREWLLNGRSQLVSAFKKGAYLLQMPGHQTAFLFNKANFGSIIIGDNNLSASLNGRQGTRYCAGNPS